MKKALLITLIFAQTQAKAMDYRNNPEAPIKISCTLPDGKTETVGVMQIYYSRAKGRAAGMFFGPNTGGFYDLNGECVVTVDPKANESE